MCTVDGDVSLVSHDGSPDLEELGQIKQDRAHHKASDVQPERNYPLKLL